MPFILTPLLVARQEAIFQWQCHSITPLLSSTISLTGIIVELSEAVFCRSSSHPEAEARVDGSKSQGRLEGLQPCKHYNLQVDDGRLTDVGG